LAGGDADIGSDEGAEAGGGDLDGVNAGLDVLELKAAIGGGFAVAGGVLARVGESDGCRGEDGTGSILDSSYDHAQSRLGQGHSGRSE